MTKPIVAFFLLAYASTWALLPLIRFSLVFALLGLFGPAAAALVVVGVTRGRPGVRQLLRSLTIWRVGLGPWVVAIGLPIALSVLAALIGAVGSGPVQLSLAPIAPVSVVLFVLVVGEELGWRGFAQPELERAWGMVGAAFVVGILWGFWHLPLFFMEGTPQRDVPLGAFLLFTTAFSVVAARLGHRTGGSVLLATVFHGTFNMVTVLATGLPAETRWWLVAGGWAVVAAGAARPRRATTSARER